MSKVVSCVLVVIFTAIILVFLLPKSVETAKNKIQEVDEYVADENIVSNYKAEYVKLTKKKVDIQNAIVEFKTNLAVTEKKIAAEKEAMAKFKNLMTKYSEQNMVKEFRGAAAQYEALEQKIPVLEKTKEGYATGLERLEKTLAAIDTTLSKIKLNLSTVENKKLLLDNFKKINKTLATVKGIDGGSDLVNLEKLDEKYIEESVKLDVMDPNTKPEDSTIQTQDDMKKYLERLNTESKE